MQTEASPKRIAAVTRDELIQTGIRMFGELGYEGTSVRALTRKAGANIASVTYHFGGKVAFFNACLDTVAAHLNAVGPERFLPANADSAAQLTEREAAIRLRLIIRSVLESAFDPEEADYVRFMHGQVVAEGRGLERFVEMTLREHHEIFTMLIARAEQRNPGDEITSARAMSIMMQTLGMVHSQRLFALLLGWQRPQDRITDLVDSIYPLPSPRPEDTL